MIDCGPLPQYNQTSTTQIGQTVTFVSATGRISYYGNSLPMKDDNGEVYFTVFSSSILIGNNRFNPPNASANVYITLKYTK